MSALYTAMLYFMFFVIYKPVLYISLYDDLSVDLDYFYPYYLFNEMRVDRAGDCCKGGKGNKSQGINLIHFPCIKQALLLT